VDEAPPLDTDYTTSMSPQPSPQSDAKHDETLIDWFLSLSPAERLAELESRIAFFYAARVDGDTKLSTNSRGP
jgi:hypothetical protein